MKLWHRNKKEKKENNNRINLLLAIIFLFGGSILFRLYNLQVTSFDLYTALASSQHQATKYLEPKRGRIFIQDQNKEEEKLYPVATNKEFALVYTKPDELENPELMADILHYIFDKDRIEKEVDEILEKYKLENMLDEKGEITKEEEEFLKVKRELEINLRKEQALNDYLKIFNKENDPYEPIARKVNEETLKKLYALIINAPAILQNKKDEEDIEDFFSMVRANNFVIKNNIVYQVNQETGEETKAEIAGIDYMWQLYRYYPEGNIGSHLLGFVGYMDDEKIGHYGLEGFFNQELFGQFGSVIAERDARGDLVIVNDREYNKAEDGSDLILTINRSIQFKACQKLNTAALRYGADGGSIIIMDPATGAIIAMCSWPDYDPNNYQTVEDIKVFNNQAIFAQYEPGSIFKTFTMAASIDQDAITPDTTYNDEGSVMVSGWPKPIRNSDYDTHGGYGVVNMVTVLEESLNTGAIFAMQQVGPQIFSDYVKDFGFGEKTGIELETESQGDIDNLLADKIKQVDAAVASFGQGIAVTPLQLVTAYAAVANGGILMKPYLVKEIIQKDGSKIITKPRQIKQVISERTALLLTGMLVNVVEGGHAKWAGVTGYYVAGKTGTAQVAYKDRRGYSDRTIHTFVGFAPAEEAKFVILVKLDDPKSVRFAASSAAPLFGELAEFILNYWEIPKER